MNSGDFIGAIAGILSMLPVLYHLKKRDELAERNSQVGGNEEQVQGRRVRL